MTTEELEQWQDDFEAFHARFADLFERSESREQVRKYLRGLLTEAQRKNSWQMAEAVGEPIPDCMQRLLYRVPWDADAARDRLQQFVIETFGDPEGIGVVDETLQVESFWRSCLRSCLRGQRRRKDVSAAPSACQANPFKNSMLVRWMRRAFSKKERTRWE